MLSSIFLSSFGVNSSRWIQILADHKKKTHFRSVAVFTQRSQMANHHSLIDLFIEPVSRDDLDCTLHSGREMTVCTSCKLHGVYIYIYI